MSKANSWADRTKAALTTVDTSDLKPVGGGSAFSKFYQFRPLGEKSSPKAAQLVPGTQIVGVYKKRVEKQRQITLKTGQKKTIVEVYYVIETPEGAVSVPNAGQLNLHMSKVVEGAKVSVTYNGMETIQKGKNAGSDAHSFLVAASELKS